MPATSVKEHKKSKCSACGTSPVSHKLLFALSFVDETIGEISDKLFGNLASTKFWNKTSSFVEKILFTLLVGLKVVQFNQDPEKAVTGRSKLIWEEANRRSIPMEQVVLLGKHMEFYRARINGKIFYFYSLPVPEHLKQTGYRWLDDKFKLFEELSKHGIPAPKAKKFSTLKEALNAFAEFKKPVIIKPKNGSRGRHTTTNINSEKDLKEAFHLARQIALKMMMQEHLFGSVYRATIINNKLVGFFKADPPKVTGHNSKTIRELIEEKNRTHHQRVSDILINEDLMNFIQRQGYFLDSVLEEGKTISLTAKTGRMYGGYTEEMLEKVHPKLRATLEKAGTVVEAPVVGFDLIIQNPTEDPETEEHWGIIECNSLPFIDLHYLALEGRPLNLAVNVWDLWKLPDPLPQSLS